eukprot:5031039-Pyramimonas_sp.AAC.1
MGKEERGGKRREAMLLVELHPLRLDGRRHAARSEEAILAPVKEAAPRPARVAVQPVLAIRQALCVVCEGLE